MQRLIRLWSLSLVQLFLIISLASAHTILSDSVFENNIQTILFYKSGKINSYPIIDINDPSQTLTLAFDDLKGGYRSFEYKIIHCNFDWTVSELYPVDYLMEGNEKGYITNYNFSTNTYTNYTNYYAIVPEPGIRFRVSGNYLLYIYEANEPEKPVITRRFYVVKSQVTINANAIRPSLPNYKNNKQEIDFEVSYQDLEVLNPLMDFKVSIQQNKRTDNVINSLQPMFVRDMLLIYDYQEENVFDACTEWRFFDIRPVKYPGQGVNKIVLDTLFKFYLLTDEDRSFYDYAEWKDINGDRVIAGENKALKMNEIDYSRVFFRLNTPYPKDEEIYIFGALSDWKIDERFKMKYIPEKNLYMADLLLKQGYYNFYYVLKDAKTGKADGVRFQGSHYETENEYLILVYYHSRFYDIYEIVGYSVINSKQ